MAHFSKYYNWIFPFHFPSRKYTLQSAAFSWLRGKARADFFFPDARKTFHCFTSFSRGKFHLFNTVTHRKYLPISCWSRQRKASKKKRNSERCWIFHRVFPRLDSSTARWKEHNFKVDVASFHPAQNWLWMKRNVGVGFLSGRWKTKLNSNMRTGAFIIKIALGHRTRFGITLAGVCSERSDIPESPVKCDLWAGPFSSRVNWFSSDFFSTLNHTQPNGWAVCLGAFKKALVND